MVAEAYYLLSLYFVYFLFSRGVIIFIVMSEMRYNYPGGKHIIFDLICCVNRNIYYLKLLYQGLYERKSLFLTIGAKKLVRQRIFQDVFLLFQNISFNLSKFADKRG